MDDLRQTIGLAVPSSSRVLAVAPDPSLLRVLSDRDCRIWSLVADDSPALRLREFCEGIVVGDLHSVDVAEAFSGLDVDTVVLAGVLAHVLFPGELLRQLTKILTADGQVVASFPNATYAARRLRFWQGVGEEEEVGPGRSLVRAFNRRRVEQLLSENGLSAVEWLRIRRPPIDALGLTLPSAVLEFLSADDDADVDHWVVVASPAAGPRVAPASLAEELQRRLHQADDEAAERRSELADFEHELEALQLDLAIKDDFALELRGKLQTAERNIARLESELVEARTELDRAQQRILTRDRELDGLRPLARRGLPALLLDRITRRAGARAQGPSDTPPQA